MLSIIALTTLLLILVSSESNASDCIPFSKGHATAYCLPGTTASGLPVQDGICAMNTKVVKENNLMGKYVVLYQRLPDGTVGNEIGMYLIADTGCKKSVIDVWMPDIEKCKEYMKLVYQDGCKGKVYYQILTEGEANDRGSNRQSIE